MTWVKIDDAIGENPKIARLSDSAFALYIAGLAYCNRNLTDGFIPSMVGIGQLRWCDGNAIPPIRELEGGNLWEIVDGGWMVHDYPVYQPPKEQVLAEREAARLRMQKVRSEKKVQANTEESSDSPVPVPVPDSEPEPVPSSKAKTAAPAARTVDNRPSHDALYLARKIDEAWGTKELTPAAMQKLGDKYGAGVVLDALRELHGFPPEDAIRKPYAYLESMCDWENVSVIVHKQAADG